MRRLMRAALWILAAVLLVGCVRAGLPQDSASGMYSLTVVLGGQHTLGAGERLPGDVYVLSGGLAVAPGAHVGGAVYVVGGQVALDGMVAGDVTLLGGDLALGPEAAVDGKLSLAGGTFRRTPGADVRGGVSNQGVPGLADAYPAGASGRGGALDALAQALIVAALAYLLARYLPGPLARVADAVVRHPLVSGAMGLLSGVIALVLIVLVAYTIILIPLSLAGGIALLAAVSFGWAAFGVATARLLWGGTLPADRPGSPSVGKVRGVANYLRRWQPRPALAAFLGTLLFMLVLNLARLLPVMASLVPLGTAAVGFGAVILTRFGLRRFVPAVDRAPELLGPCEVDQA